MSHKYPRRFGIITLILSLLCVSFYIPSRASGSNVYEGGNPPLYGNESGGSTENGGAAAASSAPSDSLAVVFVPGTAASELRLTSDRPVANGGQKISNELNWVGLSTIKSKELALAPLDERGRDLEGNQVDSPNVLTAIRVPFPSALQNLLTSHLGYSPASYDLDVYANFIAWARKTFGKRFYMAPYDWRKGAGLEASRKIDEVVDRALRETGREQVILVAHSLGGLVSRDYIKRFGQKKVAALVAVGTPWLGTPKAARALLYGYNFDVGLVSESDTRVRIMNLPGSVTNDVCSGSMCQYLWRASFIDTKAVRELSKNYPCVYQQLPTEDFMKKYAQHYGEEDGFRSVILGKDTWEKVEEFYRNKNNPYLYDETKKWREEFLDGEDYKVSHYLIGGVYSPSCKDKKLRDKKNCEVANRMDMQMAQPEQIGPSDALDKRASRLRRLSGVVPLINLYEDRYIATDSGYEWGDATAPLLSATAGVYIKGESDLRNKDAAKKYFGEDVQVQALELGPKYPHGAILDEPKVRAKLLEIYRKENEEHKLYPSIPDAGVNVETVEFVLEAEDNGLNNVVVVRLLEGEGASVVSSPTYLRRTSRPVRFENPKLIDRTIEAPKKQASDPTFYVSRYMTTTDLPGRKFSLLRRVGPSEPPRDLYITGVTVFINGEKLHKYEDRFALNTTLPTELTFPEK